MKTTTILTHGFWATLLVGAFLLGRGGDAAAVDAPEYYASFWVEGIPLLYLVLVILVRWI